MALKIHLLGPPRLERGERTLVLNLRKGLALIAYLAIGGSAHSRDSIATLLWPECDAATGRARLRRTIHEINRVAAFDLVEAQGDLLRLATTGVWIDAIVFADYAAGDAREDLAAAAEIHAADFLSGFGLHDSAEFDSWLGLQRETLRQTLVRTLERLCELHAAMGDLDRAIAVALRQLGLDPLQESVHRRLMQLYARAGQPAGALRQYDACVRVLEEELGIGPTAETDALYRSLATVSSQSTVPDETDVQTGAETPEIRYVRSGGGFVAYQVYGDGPIDVLLIPGFVSHLDWAWREPGLVAFLRRLGQSARVVLFDRRGVGLSDRTGSPPTPENTMEDARAVLDAAHMKRVVLFGCSEGGPTAALLAASSPERVRALVLYATMAKGSWSADYPYLPRPEVYEKFISLLTTEWGRPVSIETLAPSRQNDPAFRQWWAALLRFGSSPAAVRVVLEALRDSDVRPVLPTLRLPTLVMHRDEQFVRIGAGRSMAALIPGARFVELGGSDHLWWVGDCDELMQEVERFLTELQRPDPVVVPRVLRVVLLLAVPPAFRDRVGQCVIENAGQIETVASGESLLFITVFEAATAALRCALAIRGYAAGEFRAALHVGEVGSAQERRLDAEPFATARNLLNLSSPGEVLVSPAFHLLAPSPFVFEVGAKSNARRLLA